MISTLYLGRLERENYQKIIGYCVYYLFTKLLLYVQFSEWQIKYKGTNT